MTTVRNQANLVSVRRLANCASTFRALTIACHSYPGDRDFPTSRLRKSPRLLATPATKCRAASARPRPFDTYTTGLINSMRKAGYVVWPTCKLFHCAQSEVAVELISPGWKRQPLMTF